MKMTFLTDLLDLVVPRTCICCSCKLTAGQTNICLSCHTQLSYTDFAANARDNAMTHQYWGIIPIEKAVAYFYYEPLTVTGKIIHQIKYYGREDVAENFGQAMCRDIMATGFFDDIDLLVPVPMTRIRKWHRGYNQSTAIARGINSVTGIPLTEKAIKRVHFTVSQTLLSHTERKTNVENAFRLTNPDLISNRHLLIIDDIVTTGATTTACARELLKAKDVRISILSLGFTR